MHFRSTLVRSASVEGAGTAAADVGAGSEGAAAQTVLAAGTGQEATAAAGAETTAGADSVAGADTVTADKPLTPEDYKIKLPEGIPGDDALLKAFLEGAAKGGMDEKSVQAVIDSLGPKLAEQLAAPQKAWIEQNKAWSAAAKADAEFGGAKFDATLANFNKALDLVAPAGEGTARTEFLDALFTTGAGNHPAIIRVINRMAQRLAEPGTVTGNVVAQPADPAKAFYGRVDLQR